MLSPAWSLHRNHLLQTTNSLEALLVLITPGVTHPSCICQIFSIELHSLAFRNCFSLCGAFAAQFCILLKRLTTLTDLPHPLDQFTSVTILNSSPRHQVVSESTNVHPHWPFDPCRPRNILWSKTSKTKSTSAFREKTRRISWAQAHLGSGALVMTSLPHSLLPSFCPTNGMTRSDPGTAVRIFYWLGNVHAFASHLRCIVLLCIALCNSTLNYEYVHCTASVFCSSWFSIQCHWVENVVLVNVSAYVARNKQHFILR